MPIEPIIYFAFFIFIFVFIRGKINHIEGFFLLRFWFFLIEGNSGWCRALLRKNHQIPGRNRVGTWSIYVLEGFMSLYLSQDLHIYYPVCI